eukprot:GEMP01016082.1.p1 GENE.GEMP01016082.1~~GEMP01016082.1.p1  ORF type:complete len:255 (+),score=31.04 GEMP01016082.1:705-1469(+)
MTSSSQCRGHSSSSRMPSSLTSQDDRLNDSHYRFMQWIISKLGSRSSEARASLLDQVMRLPTDLKNSVALFLGPSGVGTVSCMSRIFKHLWSDSVWNSFIIANGGKAVEKFPREQFRRQVYCLTEDLKDFVGPYNIRFAEAKRRLRGTLRHECALRASMIRTIAVWFREYNPANSADHEMAAYIIRILREVEEPYRLVEVEDAFLESEEFRTFTLAAAADLQHTYEIELLERFRNLPMEFAPFAPTNLQRDGTP